MTWKELQQRLRELVVMDLTSHEFRVFAFLLGITDFENWILITQKEIAERTRIKPSNVSKALKSLEERGLILVKKIGGQNVYKINF